MHITMDNLIFTWIILCENIQARVGDGFDLLNFHQHALACPYLLKPRHNKLRISLKTKADVL